jgi:hypothetical protein
MKILVSEPLPLPAQEVFLLLRDDMPALVPYLHDVASITVTSRRDEPDAVHLVNLWQGDTAAIPGPIRKFARPELFSWNDHASWTTANRTARWRLEPRVGARVFDCQGVTSVHERGATSHLQMDIDLVIHADAVPGVPKLVARRLQPQVEMAIERQLTPNMRRLAESIRAYAASKN